LYVLDAQLQPAPVGVPGELYIGGVGVGRGYLNRPHLSAERFIPDPFSAQGGARLYRSGDRVRRLPDGALEYLGRLDHQVKLRGFRIELGEIEAAVRAHPQGRSGIRDVLVLVGKDGSGDPQLVAYLAPEPGATPNLAELRAGLRAALPDYMTPSAFVTLDAFPLTPNGKVDRKALEREYEARWRHARPELDAQYVMPRNELEQAIAALWQSVLGIEKVGVHDNFFDLGGHSLKLAKVHSRLSELANRELPMVELFKYPTISALAEYLSREPNSRASLQESRKRAAKQREAMTLG
jgi:acyl carrier protein